MMERKEELERERRVFGEFAAACRTERDRIACASLAAEDERFESSLPERAEADLLAARLIAAASA